MTRFRSIAWTLAASSLSAAPAFGLGSLVTPAGTTARVELSRSLVVRHPDRVEWIVQIKWSGDAQRAGWLLPVPDFAPDPDTGSSPVTVRPFASGALDELEAATAPTFTGVCDGAPTQEQAVAGFGESWRNGNPAVSARIVPAGDILNGALTNYLTGAGREYEVPDAVAASIDAMVDQNFMFIVVNLDMAASAQDPIISVSWPGAPADNVKLGMRPLGDTLAGDRGNVLFWTLSSGRIAANLPTTPVALDGIDFVSNVETNYEAALRTHLDARQSQAFALESAGAAPTFTHPDLVAFAAEGGTGYLTRLRGSLLPAALENNVATTTLRPAADLSDYANAQTLEGRMCGGAMPDMGTGPTADMGPVPTTDMGAVGPADAGDITDDVGFGVDPDGGNVDEGGGGGGGGGCAVRPQGPFAGVLALLGGFLAVTLGRRRRR
jgi:hypothetical protein